MFAALLEFAIVLLLPTAWKTNQTEIAEKENRRKSAKSEKCLANITNPMMEPSHLAIDTAPSKPPSKVGITPERLDGFTCVTFGISFISFNVLYWFYYLS